MTEIQGGSCEPCKRKKCKCDRQLPTCGQCAASPSLCKYAESNKRGIPSGYLGALEARLTETEAALYNALCELRRINRIRTFSYSNVSEPISSHQDNTSKASRMSEWKQYPLQSSKDVESWWKSFKPNQELSDEDHIQEPTATTQIDQIDQTRAMHWQTSDQMPIQNPRPQSSMRVGTGAVPRAISSERAVYSAPEPHFRQEDVHVLSRPSMPFHSQSQMQMPSQASTEMNNMGYDALETRNEMSYSAWHPASTPKVPSRQRPDEGGRDLNRSQQLSARMSHIYY